MADIEMADVEKNLLETARAWTKWGSDESIAALNRGAAAWLNLFFFLFGRVMV